MDTLRKIAETDADPDLKAAAREGADMVQKRVDEGIIVAPVGGGPITLPPVHPACRRGCSRPMSRRTTT